MTKSRPRTASWLLLVTLIPLYLLAAAIGIQANLASGERLFPLIPTGAQGADGYPLVGVLRVPNPAIQRGDTLVRIGDIDLRGRTHTEIGALSVPLVRRGEPIELELEREGRRFTATVAPVPNPTWWWSQPVWLGFVLVATLLLLKAPRWHLGGWFFALMCAWSIRGAIDGTFATWGLAAQVLALAFALGATPWFLFSWTQRTPPGRWEAALAIGLALASVASEMPRAHWTLRTGTWPNRSIVAITAVFVTLSLAALVRAYRHSDRLERRKLRWIFYAHFVGMLPVALAMLLEQVLPVMGHLTLSLGWVLVGAIPVGYAVAVIGYGWLDIDRLISASAAATAVGVALVGSMLAVVPAAARITSATLGIDASTGQLAFSMLLAAVLVPAYRALRPWMDRRLFAEHFVLTQRFEELRSAVGACRGVEEMATRAGHGFDALLRPDSVVIYARAGEGFAALFARGQGALPAFAADSMLIRVLEANGKPLFARDREIAPFERAALETLGAELVVPQLREKQLAAFTCLGAKRSGDIYTASDLALLASVAERRTEVIERIDSETLAREAQQMQSALRRYVPGAVADRILQGGDALEPSEREVTVLFVDIRGYTQIAERLQVSDVFATLNEHTERVSRVVQECGGTIVEFNGDGMMAVFGAPQELARKELHAVDAARRIVDSMPDAIAVGIGIATGAVFVGSIRSTDRLIWSAVGSTTNLAARLQSLTRKLGASIAIDCVTHDRAGYVCADFALHADLAIRGRSDRFDVFALPLA